MADRDMIRDDVAGTQLEHLINALTVLTPQDYVRLHAGLNGWRPTEADVDMFNRINSGDLPLEDYYRHLAGQYRAQNSTENDPAAFGALAPGGVPPIQPAQQYINNYQNWLSTGKWGG
jgi:hypothetical protein